MDRRQKYIHTRRVELDKNMDPMIGTIIRILMVAVLVASVGVILIY